MCAKFEPFAGIGSLGHGEFPPLQPQYEPLQPSPPQDSARIWCMNIQTKTEDMLRRIIDTFDSTELWAFLLLQEADMQDEEHILLMWVLQHKVIISLGGSHSAAMVVNRRWAHCIESADTLPRMAFVTLKFTPGARGSQGDGLRLQVASIYVPSSMNTHEDGIDMTLRQAKSLTWGKRYMKVTGCAANAVLSSRVSDGRCMGFAMETSATKEDLMAANPWRVTPFAADMLLVAQSRSTKGAVRRWVGYTVVC